MKDDTLKHAVAEAKRFIRTAKKEGIVFDYSVQEDKFVKAVGRTPSINGSIRRVSMDLSRALADLRQNR